MILSDYGKHLLLPQDAFRDYRRPDPSIPKSLGHHAEWIHACKTGAPTTCHFGYAGRLTEANHLGNVAYRLGRALDWDAAAMKATNAPEADRFLRRDYRAGVVPGLNPQGTPPTGPVPGMASLRKARWLRSRIRIPAPIAAPIPQPLSRSTPRDCPKLTRPAPPDPFRAPSPTRILTRVRAGPAADDRVVAPDFPCSPDSLRSGPQSLQLPAAGVPAGFGLGELLLVAGGQDRRDVGLLAGGGVLVGLQVERRVRRLRPDRGHLGRLGLGLGLRDPSGPDVAAGGSVQGREPELRQRPAELAMEGGLVSPQPLQLGILAVDEVGLGEGAVGLVEFGGVPRDGP